jgi:hypothetical protein
LPDPQRRKSDLQQLCKLKTRQTKKHEKKFQIAKPTKKETSNNLYSKQDENLSFATPIKKKMKSKTHKCNLMLNGIGETKAKE